MARKSNSNNKIQLDTPKVIECENGDIIIKTYTDYNGDDLTILDGGMFYLNFFGMCTRFWLHMRKNKEGGNHFFLSFPAVKNKDGDWVDMVFLEDVEDRNTIINAIVNAFFPAQAR